jgi:5-deoxy-glucuronate isomerase
MSSWFRPASSTADAGYDVHIAPGDPGWSYTGLYAVDLQPGESRTVRTGDCEWIVLPLSGGGATVETSSLTFALAGRADVFAGPTDLAYVPRDSAFTVTSTSGGRVALPFARAARAFPARRVDASEVPVELRGAGSCSRQVHNFGTPGTLDADSMIACEVITPAGNWSSYPPHKHDEDREGVEAALEEIYYFQLRAEPGASLDAAPFGYQRVYGTEGRPIDVLEEVRTDDVVLVPHGWHGPAMAPAGYDMYYLNVMAGPGSTRAWLICDDPSHAWVRGTWGGQAVDPRLPFGGPGS